jgi:UTP--glucose-1-phosphate uridylyltransferase
LITKCLFPAAGYGTRFLPATKSVPKEMLPILTKPLLQYGIEEAISSGITNIAIVTGRGKRSIEDHFDNSYELESELRGGLKEHYLNEINAIINTASFTYVRQRKILGLGNAILTGEPLIGNQAFAVHLADDLCFNEDTAVLLQMSRLYEKYKCTIVAIEEIPNEHTNNYGIIEGAIIDGTDDCYQVTNMVEKPNPNDSPSNMAIVGRYILTPDIFDILRKTDLGIGGEIQLTDAIRVQAKENKVIAYKFKGRRFDCGSVIGYVEAINYFAKKQGII